MYQQPRHRPLPWLFLILHASAPQSKERTPSAPSAPTSLVAPTAAPSPTALQTPGSWLCAPPGRFSPGPKPHTVAPPPPSPTLINEVDSDTPGDDVLEFVELYDGGMVCKAYVPKAMANKVWAEKEIPPSSKQLT